MAKLSPKNVFASESVDSFSGIDRTSLTGKLSQAYDMINLRILSDGSLARRDGYTCLADMYEAIAAVAVSPTQPDMLYVVSDGTLYSVSLTDGDVTAIENIGPGDATASFFSMPDNLYLLSSDIYKITSDSATSIINEGGYIPLLGREWGSQGGPIYELPNLLSRRIRIHYIMDQPTSKVYAGRKLRSVSAVYANGVRIEGSTVQDKYIQLPCIMEKGTEVLVFALLEQNEIKDLFNVLECTQAYSCGKGSDAISVIFGKENYLFRAIQVSEDKVAEYSDVYPNTDTLYVPIGQQPVTDMAGGVQAVCGEPDCLIVAGAYETRRVFPDGELVVPGIGGCASHSAMTYFNGTAYMATPQGIRRLPSRSGNGEIISAPLGDLLSPRALEDAVLYYDSAAGNLIVSDPEGNAGCAFIYDTARSCWYRFESIGARGFFSSPADTSVGFWGWSGLYMFSPGLTDDTDLNGDSYPISIYYRSRWSDLGKPDSTKRLRRLRAALSGGGSVMAELSDPTGLLCRQEFEATEGDTLTLLDLPIRAGRAIHLRLTLSSQDTTPTRIHGVAVSAIK